MSRLPSIDWLSIHQDYGDGLPEVASGRFISVVLDADGNESLDWESARSLQIEGSYSTAVLIRCAGGRVEFSGNPSRFGRPDNLFGFTTVRDCLRHVVNPLLMRYNLPPFALPTPLGRHSDGAASSLAQSDSQLSDTSHLTSGPQLTRVHLCQNYETGRDSGAVLRALEQQTWHGKPANRYGAGSLSWGSRRSLRIKWYDKAAEIRSHRTKDKESADYRERLASYLSDRGCLRYEVELNRDALRRYGLRSLTGWDDERARKIMFEIQDKMMPSVGAGGMAGIADALQADGVSARQAIYLQGLVYQWAGGVPVFQKVAEEVSLATAYRYRATLRRVGVDIRQPCQSVTSLNVQPRVCALSPLSPPAWYQHPAA